MPILMLFKSEDIPFLNERIKYYDAKCKELGFNGIYVIESIDIKGKTAKSIYSKGVVLREPSISMVDDTIIYKVKSKIKRVLHHFGIKKIDVYDYKKVLAKSISIANDFTSEKTIFLGSFSGWDSTPRHKKNGYVIDGYNKERFSYYLREQKKIIEDRDLGEFVFINAWNEWAEGMFLEPDKHFKYERLEVIKEVVDSNKI